MKEGDTIKLWGVMGERGAWFATKIEAEAHARVSFPNENPDTRYARIFYIESEPHRAL